MKKLYNKYLATCGIKYWIVYFVVMLFISLVGILAFLPRQKMGEVCLKDYLVTFNFKIAGVILLPVVSFFLLLYIIRMFDDNRIVRYVSIRKYYAKLIAGCFMYCFLYLILSYTMILLSGLISSGFVVDNWQNYDSLAYSMYSERLIDISYLKIMTAVFVVWFLIEVFNVELCIIIYRFLDSWIIGYLLCQIINFTVCVQMGNNAYIKFYINYSVYREGWNVSSLLPLVAVCLSGAVVIMLMGKADNLRKRI